MNEIKRDINLREAVRRREQHLPTMPDDLNARLLQRLEAQESIPKHRKLLTLLRWTTAAAVLAGIFFLGIKLRTDETTLKPTKEERPVTEVVELVAPIVQNNDMAPLETLPQAGEETTASKSQNNSKQTQKLQQEKAKTTASKRSRLRKQKSTLVQVEPKPTPENSEEAEMEMEQEYLPTKPDPFLLVAAEIQDIRSRGERLYQEVAQMMNNH